MDRSRGAAILSEVEQAFNFGASRLRQKHQAEFKDIFTFELRSKCLSLAGLGDLTDRHCSIRAQAGLRAISLAKTASSGARRYGYGLSPWRLVHL
jgi:hypothetical protein